MTSDSSNSHLILVPGHWLGSWAWDEVQEHLTAFGRTTTSLTLPGLDASDPQRSSRTFRDQAAAIRRVLESRSEPATIVAHSGANAPVTLVMDENPELIQRVIWVDSGPMASGVAFAADFPADSPGLPLPDFDVLAQQASLEGLSEGMLDRFREKAVSQPAPALRHSVKLANETRFNVPNTFICCSMPGSQIKELVKAGHPVFAEVGNYKDVTYVDLPTGHWPMWSRPIDLARAIAEA